MNRWRPEPGRNKSYESSSLIGTPLPDPVTEVCGVPNAASNLFGPAVQREALDYSSWPSARWLARDLCSEDDGTIDSVPTYLRPYVAGMIGEGGDLISAREPFDTPLKMARFYAALDRDAPIPWRGTGISPASVCDAYAAMDVEVTRGRRYVYFIGGRGGPVKIGVSRDPKKRLATLQTSHHTALKILAVAIDKGNDERDYHQIFASARLAGEWFTRTPAILAEIARLQPRSEGGV